MEIQTLHVPHLNAASLRKIRQVLAEVPGVEDIQADFAAESLTVHYDENQIGLISIERRIAEAGFPVKGMS